MKKSIMALALAFALGAQVPAVPAAQDGGQAVAAAVRIGGSGAQVLTINMLSDYTVDVVTAYNGVQSDERAADLINRAVADGKSSVVAAINGGFFNSYYDAGKAISFPANFPQNSSAIVQNGRIINLGGEQNVFGFTYDGKAKVDRVKMTVDLCFRGEYAKITPWDVNRYNANDASRVSLFTPKFTLPFTPRAGSVAVTIKDNRVTAIDENAGGKTMTIPKDAVVLLIHAAPLEEIKKQDKMPRLGDTVDIRYTYAPKKTEDAALWANMKTIAEGGRMLVWNGKNVARDTSFNAKFDSDSKQSATGKAQRSFIGVNKSGEVVMGTASSASFVEIADYLIGIGVTDAVNMDGGASSMLYSSGSFVTSPGRKLATALVIVKRPQKEIKPPVYVDEPSGWAKTWVDSISSLLPPALSGGYQSNITRAEYVRVMVEFMQKASGDSIDVIAAKNSVTTAGISFSDTDNFLIRVCAALGVMSGTGNGQFSPDRFLTRQEAFVMIRNALSAIGVDTSDTEIELPFKDNADIYPGALEAIQYLVKSGIIDGSAQYFYPKVELSREMAYVIVAKLLAE